MNLPDITEVKKIVADLETQLNDPTIGRDVATIKKVSRELTHQRQLLSLLTGLVTATEALVQAQSLLTESDDELRALAAEDILTLNQTQQKLTKQLEELLIPRDPLDARDIIIEIRAGAGGEEAALFAAQLFRAYSRYGEQTGWTTHIVSSSHSEQAGFKEVIAEISGTQVFGTLKYERGVHRVQRVPDTEKMGRIHTSTITVAVLPQAEEVDLEIKPEDLRIDTYRASGAGGQHVNKTSSAIRITHLPTNTVVAVQDERSQHKNKEKALSILRSRLLAAHEEARAKAEAKERKDQVGTGDRSEKIRTYNFPQDRITDHRIKKSWGSIETIMAGDLGGIFTTLQEEARNRAMSKS